MVFYNPSYKSSVAVTHVQNLTLLLPLTIEPESFSGNYSSYSKKIIIVVENFELNISECGSVRFSFPVILDPFLPEITIVVIIIIIMCIIWEKGLLVKLFQKELDQSCMDPLSSASPLLDEG